MKEVPSQQAPQSIEGPPPPLAPLLLLSQHDEGGGVGVGERTQGTADDVLDFGGGVGLQHVVLGPHQQQRDACTWT